MSKPEEVEALFKETAAAFKDPVSILVNNAGITKDGLVLTMKPEAWRAVIDINLSGVFYASKAAAGVMLRARRGRIINMASVVGQIGNPGQANYAAAKGGVLGLTKANAKEFAARGVCVNAVCPGFIESDMTEKLDLEGIKKKIIGCKYESRQELLDDFALLAAEAAAKAKAAEKETKDRRPETKD
jgi:3-oxoacyl-[acyl-carrier protein] reductase